MRADEDLRIRDPIVICSNRACRHEHRVSQRRAYDGDDYTRCPRCGGEWFGEKVAPRTAKGSRRAAR